MPNSKWNNKKLDNQNRYATLYKGKNTSRIGEHIWRAALLSFETFLPPLNIAHHSGIIRFRIRLDRKFAPQRDVFQIKSIHQCGIPFSIWSSLGQFPLSSVSKKEALIFLGFPARRNEQGYDTVCLVLKKKLIPFLHVCFLLFSAFREVNTCSRKCFQKVIHKLIAKIYLSIFHPFKWRVRYSWRKLYISWTRSTESDTYVAVDESKFICYFNMSSFI